MKFRLRLRQTALAALILVTAGSSLALTLGRARGVPLVGAPLDVAVQLRLDTPDEPDAQCIEAQVFYADAKVESGKVRVAIERASNSLDALARIRTLSAVDEPVVTIYLQYGCAQKSTRRYVLLSEAPVDTLAGGSPVVVPATVPASVPASVVASVPAAVTATVAAPAAARVPAVATVNAGAAAGANPSPAANGNRATPGKGISRADGAAPTRRKKPTGTGASPVPPVAVAEAAPVPKAAKSRAESRRERVQAQGKSRLKLDPMDLLAERDPTLRPSGEMFSQPGGDKERADAAALWRAINASPQDILRDAERARAMEGDIRALRDTVAKNETSITTLRSQLKAMEEDRYSSSAVYVLLGLLVLAAAAAAWLFLRLRQEAGQSRNDWWRGFDAAGDEAELLRDSTPGRRGADKRRAAAKPDADVDVDLTVDESLFEDLKAGGKRVPPLPARDKTEVKVSSLPPMDRVDFTASIPGVPRSVNAEELFDIHQQADFFISLGQYDQAIAVLKSHIGSNVDTSALAYLDLFKIYHTLNRKDEYAQLSQEFSRVFNAQVPPFEAFSEHGEGLEAYQMALSRIEALWPSPKVLDVIEESIFRKPDAQGETFDLEAYRELLMLYSVAKDIVDRKPDMMDFSLSASASDEEGSAAKTKFASTDIQPLQADVRTAPAAPEPPNVVPELLTMPRGSPRLGLDIDLSSPDSPASAFMESLEEKQARRDKRERRAAERAEAAQTKADGAADTDNGGELPSLGLEPRASELPPASAPAAQDSMLDFELFDSATEHEIARKPNKNG